MRRQQPASKQLNYDKSKQTKSLGARYAELLKLRETVSRTEADRKRSFNIDLSAAEEDRALPHH